MWVEVEVEVVLEVEVLGRGRGRGRFWDGKSPRTHDSESRRKNQKPNRPRVGIKNKKDKSSDERTKYKTRKAYRAKMVTRTKKTHTTKQTQTSIRRRIPGVIINIPNRVR